MAPNHYSCDRIHFFSMVNFAKLDLYRASPLMPLIWMRVVDMSARWAQVRAAI